MIKPHTKSGQDLLANHSFSRPVSAEWVRKIEIEANEEFRKDLLVEIEYTYNTSIRPFGGDELKAWNYVVRHFENFINTWKSYD